MDGLNLESKKVSKGTSTEISYYIHNNRLTLGSDLIFFYSDVKGLIDLQLRKPASIRLKMSEIMERAYNIESYVLASGAASFESGIISVL